MKKLLFVHDGPVFYDEKNNYYEFAYHNLLDRYKNLAQEISFLIRISPMTKERKYTKIPNEIKIISVPNFKGIKELKNIKHAKTIIKKAIINSDIIVFRLPSDIAQIGIKCAKKNNIPYIIECVGCAWDSYWNHSLLGKIYAPYSYINMKKTIRNSKYVYYVTEKFLQKRYPASKALCVSCSNVIINNDNDFNIENRYKNNQEVINNSRNIVIGTAAAIDVKYKGQEYVIKAIYRLNKKGYNFRYKLAGGYTSNNGSDYLKKLVKKLNLENYVDFCGSLNSDEMIEYYDSIDVYIQPSKQEGLPRSLIEAMNRGCVCFGTNIAGIPELISSQCLFKKGNVKAIEEKLMNLTNYDLNNESKKNYIKSQQYYKNMLDEKREKFYKKFLDDNFKKEV